MVLNPWFIYIYIYIHDTIYIFIFYLIIFKYHFNSLKTFSLHFLMLNILETWRKVRHFSSRLKSCQKLDEYLPMYEWRTFVIHCFLNELGRVIVIIVMNLTTFYLPPSDSLTKYTMYSSTRRFADNTIKTLKWS